MPKKLAIDGGIPAFPEGPPSWPPVDLDVHDALERAYADRSWGRYQGPHGERLRDALGAMHQLQSASVRLCCTGTIAVELALRGLDVRPGDEVILAAYDFPGNFRAIEAVGATPVLIDVERGGWVANLRQLESARSATTRAVIVSHLHGTLADMPALRKVADSHGLGIVEDACQVPGADVAGRPAGTWGDVGVLSFGGSKLMTAGRGGAILTRRDEVLQRIKIFAEPGNDAFAMSELQAAVLLPQLAKLSERNQKRDENVERLLAATRRPAGIAPAASGVSGKPSYYKLAWQITGDGISEETRDRLVAALNAEGVDMGAGFRGFCRRSQRRCRKPVPLPEAEQAAEKTLLLHHPVLLEPPETIDRLAEVITKVVEALLPNS